MVLMGKRGDEVAAVLLEAVHRCKAVSVRNIKGQGWRMTGGCGTRRTSRTITGSPECWMCVNKA